MTELDKLRSYIREIHQAIAGRHTGIFDQLERELNSSLSNLPMTDPPLEVSSLAVSKPQPSRQQTPPSN